MKLTTNEGRALAKRHSLPAELVAERRLSLVTDSAFDAFAAVRGDAGVALLGEHFRCHPKIARWFNEAFYGSRLVTLTDVSEFDTSERALAWQDIEGVANRGPRGSWVNEQEANATISILEDLVKHPGSVGVVTPFSAQASLIESIALERLGAEALASMDFRSGTAHRFQGDERDTMLFSCVVTEDMAPRTRRWIEDERNLVNVAVSRARRRLLIVGHPDIDTFGCHTLASLRIYVMDSTADGGKIPAVTHSIAELRLYEALCGLGLTPLSKPEFEGFELDFALLDGDVRLDVEVDGEHHLATPPAPVSPLAQCRTDMIRDRVLRSAGWAVVRVPAWRCFTGPSAAAALVVEALEAARG